MCSKITSSGCDVVKEIGSTLQLGLSAQDLRREAARQRVGRDQLGRKRASNGKEARDGSRAGYDHNIWHIGQNCQT